LGLAAAAARGRMRSRRPVRHPASQARQAHAARSTPPHRRHRSVAPRSRRDQQGGSGPCREAPEHQDRRAETISPSGSRRAGDARYRGQATRSAPRRRRREHGAGAPSPRRSANAPARRRNAALAKPPPRSRPRRRDRPIATSRWRGRSRYWPVVKPHHRTRSHRSDLPTSRSVPSPSPPCRAWRSPPRSNQHLPGGAPPPHAGLRLAPAGRSACWA
jgi:hypothetical protein